MATIQEQILKAIEIDSRIKGLENQVRESDSNVSDLGKAILHAQSKKENTISEMEEAGAELIGANNLVELAEKAVSESESRLNKAMESAAEAQQKSEAFTDVLLAGLDDDIASAKKAKDGAVKDSDDMKAELSSTREKLAVIIGGLKEKGYELNIGVPKAKPKTTTL